MMATKASEGSDSVASSSFDRFGMMARIAGGGIEYPVSKTRCGKSENDDSVAIAVIALHIYKIWTGSQVLCSFMDQEQRYQWKQGERLKPVGLGGQLSRRRCLQIDTQYNGLETLMKSEDVFKS